LVGFSLSGIGDENARIFAHQDFAGAPRHSRFGVRPEVFEQYGAAILKNIRSGTKLIVIDEIGVMEKQAKHFLHQFWQILDGPLPVLAVVQKRADYIWRYVERREDSAVFCIDHQNRETITSQILALLRNHL